MAIIAILATLWLPSHVMWLTTAKQEVASQQLLRAISLARSAAQLHGNTVSICGSTDQQQCDGQWQTGQIIWVDAERSGKVKTPNDILYVLTGFPAAALHWRSALAKPYLSLSPDGTTHAEDGSFWYCARGEKKPAWIIAVNQAGRARLVYPRSQGELDSFEC